MARLDLNQETASEFIARINKIETAEQRQWGTMEPQQLLRHLTYLFEISLGEKKAEKIFMPMPTFVIWLLFFDWFTNWPKGKLEAPDSFFPDGEESVEAARNNCTEALHRFCAQLESAPDNQGFSPLLGNIPLRKWARVHGVHMDHHLRQYGV